MTHFSFRAETLSFANITKDITTSLHIPQNQRGYSWDKKPISKLIEDINEAIECNDKEFFIGPVTFQIKNNSEHSYEVIDGQQRLTTLSLIEYFLSKKTKQPQLPKPLIKFRRDDDRATYLDIMGIEATHSKTKLTDAYTTIKKLFQDFNDTQYEEFLEYLHNHVIFIVIICENEDISYKIFESLNDRGMQLSPVDLIRNYLFSNLSASNLEQTYKAWDDLYKTLKSVLNNTDVDKHIQQLLAIKLNLIKNKWLETKSLFPELKDYINGQEISTKQFLDIACSDQSSSAYIRTRNSSDLRNSMPQLQLVMNDCVKRYKVVQPLCYVMFYKNFDTPTVIKILENVRALIKRTLILGKLPVQKYGVLLTSIASQIYNEAVKESDALAYVNNRLRTHNGPEASNLKFIMDDPLFIEQVSALPSIDEGKAKEIFWAFYNYSKGVNDVTLKPSSDIHIEHILPKKLPENGWGEFTENQHKNYFQRLGNLILLDGNNTSEDTQKYYVEKKMNFKNSQYFNIALLDDSNDWNTQSINVRQRRIAEQMVQVWNIQD